jgi:hypothetical protein
LAHYRAYFVGSGGNFIAYEALVCRDDDEAVAKAKQFVDDHDIEVWCKDRFVRRLVRRARKKLRYFRVIKSPRWNQEDNKRLLELSTMGMPVARIAKELKRTESAITARLVILKKKTAPSKSHANPPGRTLHPDPASPQTEGDEEMIRN